MPALRRLTGPFPCVRVPPSCEIPCHKARGQAARAGAPLLHAGDVRGFLAGAASVFAPSWSRWRGSGGVPSPGDHRAATSGAGPRRARQRPAAAWPRPARRGARRRRPARSLGTLTDTKVYSSCGCTAGDVHGRELVGAESRRVAGAVSGCDGARDEDRRVNWALPHSR